MFTNWVVVVSSRIWRMRYSEELHAMDVQFKRGKIYRYVPIMLGDFENVVNAHSAGEQLNALISDAEIEYEEVSL